LTDTHVLLIKNVVGSRQWTLPGGGYHSKESGEQCAKREVREELGITLTHLQPIGAVNELSRGATWNYDCFVSHLDEISEIHLSIELSDAQWFAVANLPITIRPYARKLIEQYAGPHSPIE
jgi:8-oxo-dGTP pyrophosphatase MutT (NUDIX family)